MEDFEPHLLAKYSECRAKPSKTEGYRPKSTSCSGRDRKKTALLLPRSLGQQSMEEYSSTTEPAKRPNESLSVEERQQKKRLKKILRVQARIKVYENRIRNCRDHKYDKLESELKEELRVFKEKNQEFLVDDGSSDYDAKDTGPSRAMTIILDVYSKLQRRNKSVDRELASTKAREMLQHMTKGTQTLDMFDNEEALWGYTRQKFNDRAALVASALDRLYSSTSELDKKRSMIIEKLESISSVCSIGCGPGCDAVGFLAFVRAERPRANVKRVILMDWAIHQWLTVLTPLRDILVPSFTSQVITFGCDVTQSLGQQVNADANKKLFHHLDDEPYLFICSYLLSETREKWQTFFDDLIDRALKGTLFLFSDPTAWQILLWLKRYRSQIVYQWLDSSMYVPELQDLEGRTGPAILLAMKVDNPDDGARNCT